MVYILLSSNLLVEDRSSLRHLQFSELNAESGVLLGTSKGIQYTARGCWQKGVSTRKESANLM
jgi:hypothetical protein